MKKLLLGLFTVLAGISANAQLADGSDAPDFTATDINGVEHTLSEYLAQGKTVIIDISATWCGPCWNYHGTGALEDIYYSYGEGGSDEIVVLFIEGDPGTSVSSIYGVNVPGDNGTTQGDWTKGSPYPIIDDTDGDISDAYEIAYFPTVYRICPDGKTKELTQPTRAQIKSSVNSGCGTLTGVTNNVLTSTSDIRVCSAGDSGVVKATVKNYGTNSIPAATVTLKQGSTVLGTQTTSGSMAAYATKTVTFDAVEFDPSLEYSVEVTDVNGNAPSIVANAVAGFDVFTPNTGTNNIVVNLYTDNYPSEISWKIFDSNNEVVAEGGPYQAGTDDQWGGGGPDANTVKTSTVELSATDCYKVELYDSFGDGWSLGSTQHGIEIIDGYEEVVFEQSVANFGSTLSVSAAFKTNGTTDATTVEARKFALYPNPTTGVINFSTEEAVNVSIIDVTGKTVFTATNINDGQSINLGSLQKGIYIAQIKGETTQKTEKVVIN